MICRTRPHYRYSKWPTGNWWIKPINSWIVKSVKWRTFELMARSGLKLPPIWAARQRLGEQQFRRAMNYIAQTLGVE